MKNSFHLNLLMKLIPFSEFLVVLQPAGDGNVFGRIVDIEGSHCRAAYPVLQRSLHCVHKKFVELV